MQVSLVHLQPKFGWKVSHGCIVLSRKRVLHLILTFDLKWIKLKIKSELKLRIKSDAYFLGHPVQDSACTALHFYENNVPSIVKIFYSNIQSMLN